MFYFLLFHSSITKTSHIDKKILITALYGSILYIIFHAIVNSSKSTFLVTIKKYFFLILSLDVLSMIYILKNLLPKVNVSPSDLQNKFGTLFRDHTRFFYPFYLEFSSYKKQTLKHLIQLK